MSNIRQLDSLFYSTSGVGRGRKGACWMLVQVRGFKFAGSRTRSKSVSQSLHTLRVRIIYFPVPRRSKPYGQSVTTVKLRELSRQVHDDN